LILGIIGGRTFLAWRFTAGTIVELNGSRNTIPNQAIKLTHALKSK